jgi:hypothetical protein
MNNNGKAIRKALNATFIKYYPELGRFFDSICAAVLLKQIDYMFSANGDNPFHVFKEPCENERYVKGNSWTEILGISKNEFNSALAKIGAIKVTKGVSLTEAKKQNLVVYWTDKNRLTWYWLNIEKYNELLETAFIIKDEKTDLLCKAEKRIYIVKQENELTLNKKDNNKDIKKEEEEEQPKKTASKKPALKPQQTEKDAPPQMFDDQSEMAGSSSFLWKERCKNNPELYAKLKNWAYQQILEGLPRVCKLYGKQYTDEQLQTWTEQQLIRETVNIQKTEFTMYGEPIECDTVKHMLNRANLQLRDKGGLDIATATVKQGRSKSSNYQSPFK